MKNFIKETAINLIVILISPFILICLGAAFALGFLINWIEES